MGKTWQYVIDILGGRKFLVFLIGSLFLVLKFISQDIWLWVVGIYVSGNIAEAITDKLTVKVEQKQQ